MLPRLLLLGSGPTHLLLLEALARRREPSRETILVASVQTELSPGTLPGLLGGRYRPSEVGINLERLAQAATARIVVGEVRAIEPLTRTVRLMDGQTLLYNAASIATGPFPSTSRVPGASRYARFLHSLEHAMEVAPALEALIRELPEQLVRIVIVGGSPEALEVAMTLRSVLDHVAQGKGVVTLVAAAHAVWRVRGSSARLAEAALRRNDITAVLGAQIMEVTERQLVLSNGARVAFDLLIWASADEVPEYFARAEPAEIRERHLVVDEHLQVANAPGLFAAGEVTIKQDEQLTSIGVEPERGSRVIADNLLATLAGRPPSQVYQSRTRFHLAETGGTTALLSYGKVGLEGKWLLRLKQRADRKLIERLSGARPHASR